MTSAASVGGDERLRLFLALQLPDDVLDDLARWQAGALPAGLRVVPRDHLHVTLAFLGHRPAAELPAIVDALRAAASPERDYRLGVDRYRETRSVAMVVLADVGGGATALADDVQQRLEALGVYRREGRPWLPHVTVARFRDRPRLRLAPPIMRTGVLIPSDAAAYLSRPGPKGARYEVLTTVALGG
ncbi:MAG TPA: RNA 2',3'-cyclic phosphodiesterase [Gaiellaceae bacterium]|nr:RNA 2',3'-cyclic phosphodiesterase [Gaiellaceae bacterium]